MRSEIAEPTQEALALVKSSVARLAAATEELARSRAWQDVLATVDQLAALLGAEVGSPAPVPADADPARIARFVTDWVESLLLPEYLESVAPGEARYRVRLPEEARADGLGDLVDFLESLALRLDLGVKGGAVRLALTVGSGERPALAAACAADRLQLDLDLGATRGAVRHMAALAGRFPVARQLQIAELSGVLRLSFAAGGAGRLRLACAIAEPVRVVGRTEEGPLRIDVGASELVAIEGEAEGSLRARVEVGPVAARLPASVIDAGSPGSAEYRLAGAGGELQVMRGDRAFRLRRLTLGGQAGVALRDGKRVATVELGGQSTGFDIEPREPGRFVLAPEGELALRLGRAGQEVTLSVPAGTQLEMAPGRLEVRKGRVVLDGTGATAPLEIREGRALVRREEPRSEERHPLLRFYTSAGAG